MPKRYIHICGDSAVGKKRLIKKMIDDPTPGLREQFGIDSDFQAYGFNHPGIRPMYDYFLADKDIVVHLWQYADHGWIAHHDRESPGIDQRIYLLWLPYDDHSRYVAEDPHRKAWNPPPSPREMENRWRTRIVPLFRKLQTWGFTVEVLNASTDRYKPMAEWPG